MNFCCVVFALFCGVVGSATSSFRLVTEIGFEFRVFVGTGVVVVVASVASDCCLCFSNGSIMVGRGETVFSLGSSMEVATDE